MTSNQFLYLIEKKETKENIILTLYSVDDKHNTITKQVEIPYQILANKEDFNKLGIKSDNVVITPAKLKDIDNNDVIKINANNKEIYDFILSELRDINSKVYEHDLPVEHKYLIDNNLSLTTSDTFKPILKYLSIDIETVGQKEDQKIIMISSFSHLDKKMSKVYCDMSKVTKSKLDEVNNHNFKDFELVKCENEEDLLIKFQNDCIEFSPQMLIGWNVIDFDFKIIKQRLNIFGIDFKLSKFGGNCRLRLTSDFFSQSTMTCPGTLVFDMIHVLKKNFYEFDDFKLNTVARAVLGDEKIDIEDDSAPDSIENKIVAIENMFKKDPVKLIEYNFKDSLLTSQIVEKLHLLDLVYKRSILTGTPLAKVKSPIATLDIMYLKELHKRGFVANTNWNFQKSSPIEGAFVVEPTQGFYEDVMVLDFKSLYPSVMMTFNIDPFTQNKGTHIQAPNGATFSNEPGILPKIILELYKERDIAKQEGDKNKSQALKITMNSFYGAMASPKSRYHNTELGESITAFARHITKTAIIETEKLGHKVVYGDTDSIFVKLKDLSPKEKINVKVSAGKVLENHLNKYFQNWVTKEFKQKNYLQIEFEKLYSKFFIATKKRYVGYDEFTKKTQFVGMQAIRGDWTMMAKEFQVKLIELIFNNKEHKEIEQFLLDEIKQIKAGKFDDKLVYTKKIAKPLSEYTKITPPHVKAAKEVVGFSGRVVKYVLTKQGPRHVSLFDKNRDELDYNHYIEKQLKGVSVEILDCIGISFDEIVFKKKQTSLSAFF